MSVPFRFIHAADLHVDSPFKGLQDAPEPIQAALRDSTFKAVQALTDTAIAEEVDFIVIAGDLYDAADRSLRAQLALQREWKKLAVKGIGVYAIHGNHDPLSGSRARLELPSSVRIFGSSEPEGWPAYNKNGDLAAYVYGLSYGSRVVSDNVALRYRTNPAAPFHLALLHGNVDGDPSHDPYAPCKLSELAGAGFDYWALGHIHERKVLLTYPHVVYAGNTQGRHARETGEKGCYLVEVSAAKEVKMRFLPLDAVRFLEAAISIEGLDSEQALKDRLEEACEDIRYLSAGRPVMLKTTVNGRGQLHSRLTDPVFCKDLLQELRESLYKETASPQADWIWIHRLEVLTSAELALDELRDEESFAGELLRLSERIESDAEARKALITDALAPIQEQARLRKLLKETGEVEADRIFSQAREYVLDLLIGGEGRT